MVRMPCAAIVLNWRNETPKPGLYPVHIRIKIGTTARYYNVPIPQKIRLDQWSGIDSIWVKPCHPFAFEINTAISEKRGLINDYIKRNYNVGKPITVDGILAQLTNKG